MKFKSLSISLGLIAAVAATRFLPHPPNFTPVMSVALFGSAVIANRYVGIFIAVGAMALSDAFLGSHATLPYVYGAMVVVGLFGFLLRQNRSALKIVAVSAVGSLLFFFITNLGVFFSQNIYPKTAAGLATCFAMALPFLKNSLAGDFIFTGALFTLHYFAERKLEGERLAQSA